MLPEHIKMIEDLWGEDNKRKKPMIDEQQKEEFDLLLHLALKDYLTVHVTYFVDHDFHTVKDKLLKIDLLNRYLYFNHNRNKVHLDDVIDVAILS